MCFDAKRVRYRSSVCAGVGLNFNFVVLVVCLVNVVRFGSVLKNFFDVLFVVLVCFFSNFCVNFFTSLIELVASALLNVMRK